jgi:hypothetical protein
MINKKYMPTDTAKVFEALSVVEPISGFTLIGGTALAIQVGHRFSEDLDFWTSENLLPKGKINNILANLRANGLSVSMLTPAWRISQAKINGIDLLSHCQDYLVDGVKVTFFARADAPYLHFSTLENLKQQASFNIANLDSIFAMKSWVISQRVKSRDLFDLMFFVKNGKTIQDILDAGFAADTSWSNEYAKEVLVGNVALDKNDEGLHAVVDAENENFNLPNSIDGIYDFFEVQVNSHEEKLTRKLAADTGFSYLSPQ